MMFALTLLSALISTAYASPGLLGRQSSGACAGLGGLHVYDNASNFTLAALNTTLPNANSSGVPLVLASNSFNNIPSSSTVLATWASFPDDFWPGPEMSMVNGALIPAADGNFVAYDVNVTAGYGLGFMVTDPGSDEPGVEIYCIQDDGPPTGFQHAVLAVFGNTGDFSLCTSSAHGTGQASQNQIIYKAFADNDGQYDYSTCYAVTIQLIY